MTQSLIIHVPQLHGLPQGTVTLIPGTQEKTVSRLDSYDIARAVAVMGMILVNYYSILLGSFEEESLFADIADILFGRAAALFIILAGIGTTLLGKKALTDNDPRLLFHFRKEVIKRCLVLFVMGHLFWFYWPADILHFYSFFLIIGALLISCSSRILWGLILGIAIGSAMLFWFTGGNPDDSSLFVFEGVFLQNGADLLFSGCYASFPWISYLLAGIWFGKSLMIFNKGSHRRIFFLAFLFLVTAEVLLFAGESSSVSESFGTAHVLLFRSTFPLSPLHHISAGASAFLVLIIMMWACGKRSAARFFMPIRSMGRMSLTIYIVHIFLAYTMFELNNIDPDSSHYLNSVIMFYFVSCLIFIGFANIWCNSFKYGPLEWVMRKAAKVGE